MSLDPKRPRVLVVDDDPFVLELLTIRLEIGGYQTFHARNGHEALGRLREVKPAAMLLDVNMPLIDGFGVLKQMTPRAAPACQPWS